MAEEKFYELSEDVITTFKSIYDSKSFPINIGFKFIGASKQKQLIKTKKLGEDIQFIINKDIIVSINEDIYYKFDDESRNILIEQELDKYYVDPKSGKIKSNKPDLITTSGIINKYGIDKVAKANEIEDLYNQQKEDGQLDKTSEAFIV